MSKTKNNILIVIVSVVCTLSSLYVYNEVSGGSDLKCVKISNVEEFIDEQRPLLIKYNTAPNDIAEAKAEKVWSKWVSKQVAIGWTGRIVSISEHGLIKITSDGNLPNVCFHITVYSGGFHTLFNKEIRKKIESYSEGDKVKFSGRIGKMRYVRHRIKLTEIDKI